jgi:hypothetical protein
MVYFSLWPGEEMTIKYFVLLHILGNASFCGVISLWCHHRSVFALSPLAKGRGASDPPLRPRSGEGRGASDPPLRPRSGEGRGASDPPLRPRSGGRNATVRRQGRGRREPLAAYRSGVACIVLHAVSLASLSLLVASTSARFPTTCYLTGVASFCVRRVRWCSLQRLAGNARNTPSGRRGPDGQQVNHHPPG